MTDLDPARRAAIQKRLDTYRAMRRQLREGESVGSVVHSNDPSSLDDIVYLLAVIASLQGENTELMHERDAVVWECAGKLAFVFSHDVPETERAAKAVLVRRCEKAEADVARLQAERDEALAKATYEIGTMNEVLLAAEAARDEAQRDRPCCCIAHGGYCLQCSTHGKKPPA